MSALTQITEREPNRLQSDGFVARYGVEPESPVCQIGRREATITTPAPNPFSSLLLYYHLAAPSTAAARESCCYDLPAHRTQQQQQQGGSTEVRGLRGLFAKHSSWGSGRVWSAALGRGGAGSLCVMYTGGTAVILGIERTIISSNLYLKKMGSSRSPHAVLLLLLLQQDLLLLPLLLHAAANCCAPSLCVRCSCLPISGDSDSGSDTAAAVLLVSLSLVRSKCDVFFCAHFVSPRMDLTKFRHKNPDIPF